MMVEKLKQVPTYEKVLVLYNNTAWSQTLNISDAENYHDFKAQWRASTEAPKYVDLDVTVNGELVTMSASPEKIAQMQGQGVIDIRALPGPKTFMKFITEGEGNVTR